VVTCNQAGDLKRQLRKALEKEARFDERVIWKYFSQIALGKGPLGPDAIAPPLALLWLALWLGCWHHAPELFLSPRITAVNYMHTQRVMHRDLKVRKPPGRVDGTRSRCAAADVNSPCPPPPSPRWQPANIFLTLDGTVKVGDLGLGRMFSADTVQAFSKVRQLPSRRRCCRCLLHALRPCP
jgi:serine/threonine protein kinase